MDNFHANRSDLAERANDDAAHSSKQATADELQRLLASKKATLKPKADHLHGMTTEQAIDLFKYLSAGDFVMDSKEEEALYETLARRLKMEAAIIIGAGPR